jgi:hypothetical protein
MSVLKIHLSYHCSAECEHCHLYGSRQPSAVIPYDLAMMAITELVRLNRLDYVVLLGGEPGLFPELTQRLTTSIRALGLGARIETNASWATGPDRARAFLGPLYAAGACVMYSLDAFHEPFVPLERLACAIRVSDELGGQYNLEIPYLDYANRDNSYDLHTRELIEELSRRLDRKPCAPMFEGPVFFKGRAAERLAAVVAKGRGVPHDVCAAVPWWSHGEQDTLELLGLDAYGYLSKECGIALGDLKRDSVERIVKSFDAQRHPILRTLIVQGPLGLAREAAELGYVLKQDYADKCHLCQEARNALRVRYPEYLAPERHYVQSEVHA